MKKGQASKTWVNQRVRFHPPARRSGVPVDDDWIVTAVEDDSVTFRHVGLASVTVVALDGIRSYFSDRNRDTADQQYGMLDLWIQVDITPEGEIKVAPLAKAYTSVPPSDPMDTPSGRIAAKQYQGLPRNWKGALAYLLFVGRATDQQLRFALVSSGYGEAATEVLRNLQPGRDLIQRVELVDSKKTLLHGYDGAYEVNPSLRSAPEQLVRQDEELRAFFKWLG
jgi:hypothetical protein